jgi:hypothetical protein
MKHKNETSGERAVAGPLREPRGLGYPGNHQRYVEDGGLWLHTIQIASASAVAPWGDQEKFWRYRLPT